MTDRYHQGLQRLREAPVPDQWSNITDRLARQPQTRATPQAHGATGVNGAYGSGRDRPGRHWSFILAVAASIAVVVAAVALFARDDPDVTTGRPAATTGPDGPPSSSRTSSTTTTTPTPTSTPPLTGVPPNQVVDVQNYPVSACRGLRFTATAPPNDVAGTMQEVAFDDPRVPTAVHGNLTGVFPSSATTRAVFVVAGWPGLQDDAGIYIDGPFTGVQSWIAPYDDGWLAEIAAPASPDTSETFCPFTLIGLGLDEADMRQFLNGLALEG